MTTKSQLMALRYLDLLRAKEYEKSTMSGALNAFLDPCFIALLNDADSRIRDGR